MFVFISHLEVPEEDRARLEGHFRNRARLVDGFPGFLRMQLLRPESGKASFTVVTIWADGDAFRRYMRSPEYARSQEREPTDIMVRTTVRHEAFHVLMDSECDPEWLGG